MHPRHGFAYKTNGISNVCFLTWPGVWHPLHGFSYKTPEISKTNLSGMAQCITAGEENDPRLRNKPALHVKGIEFCPRTTPWTPSATPGRLQILSKEK